MRKVGIQKIVSLCKNSVRILGEVDISSRKTQGEGGINFNRKQLKFHKGGRFQKTETREKEQKPRERRDDTGCQGTGKAFTTLLFSVSPPLPATFLVNLMV